MVTKKVEKLIADGKYLSASVLLTNFMGEISPKEFKELNHRIKQNFPRIKGGRIPTSCGKKIRHKGLGN